MDNKELSLEDIIAKNAAEKQGTAQNSAESLNDIIDAEKNDVDEIGDIADANLEQEEVSVQKRKLTADEILAGETFADISDDAPLKTRHTDLTVDEILGEVNPVDADVEDIKAAESSADPDETAQASYEEPETDTEETDHDGSADSGEEYDDEYDDIDNEPTVVMPKHRQRSERYRSQARRPRRRKVHKKQKPGKFNGTIFGGIILTCIILTVSIVLAITGISIATEYYGIGKDDKDVIFNIPEGSTNENIADLLYENNIINNKTLFLLALKIEKPQTIFPGDITLQASMGYPDIIEKLATQRKKLKTVNVTITEGMNLLEVANLLEKNKVCKAEDFLFEFNKDQGFDFEKDLNVSKDAFYKMEGYFYPETYNFYVDDTAYNVTKIVREQFQNVLNADIMSQVKANKLSLNQIITLASIVQMEAANEKEMPKVASVFINRLNNPDVYPNLQSNTTDKYIEKVIKKKAIDATSAEHYTALYDTYKCTGLPVSPICNPGLAAIKAVLNPAKTDYYYFCNNLATGETFYARTDAEHEVNKKKAGLA